MGREPEGLRRRDRGRVAIEAPGRDRSFLTALGSLAAFGRSMIATEVITAELVLLCGYFLLPSLQGEASRGWTIVKLGDRGCLAVSPDGGELAVPAPNVRVLDTTGAGDAFNAGLLHALARDDGWPEALEFATRVASTAVSRPSADRYPRIADLV